jgi:hypothetical protein
MSASLRAHGAGAPTNTLDLRSFGPRAASRRRVVAISSERVAGVGAMARARVASRCEAVMRVVCFERFFEETNSHAVEDETHVAINLHCVRILHARTTCQTRRARSIERTRGVKCV